MDYHQQFHRAAIERGIPEDEVSKFAEFLRFAVWTSERPNGVPVGRSGGLPRLPVGMEWPSSEHGPLPFVASFDCAALPGVVGLALPSDGSLLLFLHHEWAHDAYSVAHEQRFARVVYVPAGNDTATAGKRNLRLEEEALRVMREWVPLAQFVPDEVYQARFLIRHDDVAAGRFDKALSFTAFTE